MKSIHIVEDTLPVAWEKAVLACWEQGDNFPTEYDKDGDPNSRDVTALIHVKNPMAEPRIHKALPGGLHDLEKYRSEMLYGVHDYFMDDKSNPERWKYTYYQRLFGYETQAGDLINQINKCVEMLKKCGYTRRAQAITWQPWKDLGISDPPCLQSLLFRIEEEKLNMNVRFRSNDLYKAAFFNAHVLVELQKDVANQVGVEIGELMWVSESMHIYGSYFDEVKSFINRINKTNQKDRVWDTEVAIPFFIDGCIDLLSEGKMPENKKQLVRERKNYLESLLSK